MTIVLDSAVTIVVLASNSCGRAQSPLPDLSDENALSVALIVSYRGFNYFAGGDLTAEVEQRLLMEATIGDVDLYRVSHYGSAKSSSPAFLAAIRPQVAVISAGSHCGFHHPDPTAASIIPGSRSSMP